MVGDPLSEIITIVNDKAHAEKGGGHNNKGVEFQKHWALIQMLSLEEQGATDFLFLFEVIQDVTIVDSCHSPKQVKVFQIKKKDRGEWSWTELTKVRSSNQKRSAASTKKGRTPKPPKASSSVAKSPMGRLYAAVRAFGTLDATGTFISNAGCDLEMADGSNAATSLPVSLGLLPLGLKIALEEALSLQPPQPHKADVGKLSVAKIDLPVNDTTTYTIGKVHDFLTNRSPRHAGQARSLVEGLLAAVSPLGAKTDTCRDFAEVQTQHGFSRKQFQEALGSLQQLPDVEDFLALWLAQLQQEGMSAMEATSIRAAVAGIYRRQVIGSPLPDETRIAEEAAARLGSSSQPAKLAPYFASALLHLQPIFPNAKRADLQAHFAIQAIKKCVDQI